MQALIYNEIINPHLTAVSRSRELKEHYGMKEKTLILYGTRGGATRQTAELIGSHLSDRYGKSVEIINIGDFRQVKRRLTEFSSVIIGSSIRSGRWVSKCLRVLRFFKGGDQRVFVYVTAGGTMNKVDKYGITREEAVQEGIKNYIDNYLEKFGMTVSAKTAFGGWVRRKDDFRYNNWDREEIIQWADHLASLA